MENKKHPLIVKFQSINDNLDALGVWLANTNEFAEHLINLCNRHYNDDVVIAKLLGNNIIELDQNLAVILRQLKKLLENQYQNQLLKVEDKNEPSAKTSK